MDKFSTELIQILTNTAFSDDPLRCMVEALCSRIMNTEVTLLLNAEKSERTKGRKPYRSGYRERDWNTRLGTIQLSVPKLRKGGYVPCFLEKGKKGKTEQHLLLNSKKFGLQKILRRQESERATSLTNISSSIQRRLIV